VAGGPAEEPPLQPASSKSAAAEPSAYRIPVVVVTLELLLFLLGLCYIAKRAGGARMQGKSRKILVRCLAIQAKSSVEVPQTKRTRRPPIFPVRLSIRLAPAVYVCRGSTQPAESSPSHRAVAFSNGFTTPIYTDCAKYLARAHRARQGRGLNRVVLDSGFGLLRQLIVAKGRNLRARWRGSGKILVAGVLALRACCARKPPKKALLLRSVWLS